MTEETVATRIVYNCSVGNYRDELVVLTLRVGTDREGEIHYEDLPFSFDRRVAEHLLDGLAQAILKLPKPRTAH
jgi:hypothetical protein